VEELWIVDPAARRVELFRLQENPEQPAGIYGGKDTFTSSCFPGLQLRPSEIFQR
jgi:Uma2 family endonuclease